MLRRDFLSATLVLGISSVRPGLAATAGVAKDVLNYGARPDGKTLCTRAIQRAIDDVARAGGGTVRLPSGTFLSGRIDLKSEVTLHLDAGCTLLGSDSIDDYKGPEYGNLQQRHLIFAADAEDVVLSGPGRIDGQGPKFWEPSGQIPLPGDEQWRAVASHDMKPKKSGRPSPLIYFVNCRRVRIEGIRIENSPGWTLNTVNCDDVHIEGISIRNPVDGPNTDGIDLTGCQDVQILNCAVETGDDAICLKTTNPYGPEPRAVRNVVVIGCSLTTCCNGFKVGTETQGGFENITFSNSTVFSKDVPFKDRVISGVALEVVDGGWIDGVTVSNIQMERTRAPIFIHIGDRKRPYNYPQHGLRHIRIENIKATDSLLPSSITGLPGVEVDDVTISKLRVSNALSCRPEWVGRAVDEKPTAYPEAWMFGMLPASGLYARHVRNLHFDEVELSATAGEARPAIVFDDVIDAAIAQLSATPVNGHMPVVQLTNCRDVQLSHSAAAAGTGLYLGVMGGNSQNISLRDDNLRKARKAFETSAGASSKAVKVEGDISPDK